MNNGKLAFFAFLLALLFIVPPANMLQYDSSPEETFSPLVDESVSTNEQGVETTPEDEQSAVEETPPVDEDVNVEDDRSSKKFLDAFKLNFDPYNPDDGEEIECTATIHNFGTERQIAYNVNVEFYADEKFIGAGTINEIQPQDNGSATIDWVGTYGSHNMKVIADPDGSDGGPDEYEVILNVSRSNYAVGLTSTYNSSWIKNSQTNTYYIEVENRGENQDTIDLTLETTYYGNDDSGWSGISLSTNSITLGAGKSDYVELDVKYLSATVDYTSEAVVKVTAQSQGDSTRSDVLYTTTNVIHNVPILYVDDDGQHDDQPRGSYSVIGGQYGPETDEINLGSLEKHYKGLYHHVELDGDYQPSGSMSDQGPSGPPYDSNSGISPYTIDSTAVYLKNYDIIIWDCGYSETLTGTGANEDGSAETHSWYDQTELSKYLDNGGSLIWMNNKGTEWHDRQAGTYTNPLYTDYFNALKCVQQGGLTYQIVGVTKDPVGVGVDVVNSFIYSLAGDRSDAITPGTGAEGVYYAGSGYSTIRYEHARESGNSQRFKTILQTKNWAHFGDYNDYENPMRVRSVTNSLTWLGVPMTNAPEFDLTVESIESPFGEYVQPGASIPLECIVMNTGQKDITTDFSVIFRVKDGTSTVFQRTVDVSTDLASTESLSVSTNWDSSKPVNGHTYNITYTISYTADGNEDNDEKYTVQEAKSLKDVAIIEANYEKSTFYWNSTRIGDDTEVWCKVLNQGSVDATFRVDLVIKSPLNTEVYGKTTMVEGLAPGREQKVSWIWTPRNPAGYLTNWHFGVNDRAHEDQYDATFTVTYNGDEDPDNDERGIGTSQAPGIVVMGYTDLSEPRLMSEDWYAADLSNHDDHGNDYEMTPLHLQSNAYVSPTHSWNAGYGDEDGDLSTIEEGWSTVVISPLIDMKNYTRARGNWLFGGRSGAGTMYWEVSRDYDGNPSHIEDATWSSISSTSGGTNTYGWYINTAGYTAFENYCGDEIYMRLRFVSDSDGGICGPFVDEIAICGVVDQYNANDLGVTKVSIDPLIEEMEMARNIDITVENFGENKTNSGGRPGFRVELSIWEDSRGEVYNRSQNVNDVLGIGDSVTVSYNEDNGKAWWPEDNGIYTVRARTYWEQDGDNIDENPANDIMMIDGVVQKSFFSDDMESGAGDWQADGGPNGWALGTPTKGPSPYSGDNCWGTNLDGNYPDLNDGSITLEHYVDLKTASDPVLTFWHWLEVEAHDYDTAFVEARTEEGSWTTIWTSPSPARVGIPFETNGWRNVTVKLDDFAYHDMYIRFRLETDGDTNYLGWYLDDIAVGGTRPPDHDARIVSIDYPIEGSFIPPGETIEVQATVMNVGLNQEVIGVVCTAERQGGSPKTFDVGDEDTELLNPGDKEVITFNWNLPLGTAEYELKVETDLGTDQNLDNNEQMIYIFGQEVYDIGIATVYANPMVQDVARTRTISAEILNVGNTNLDNIVEVTFEAYLEGNDDPRAEYTVTTSLGREETKTVDWDWQSYKYGTYHIDVEATIKGKVEDNLLDNSMVLENVITIETIFLDTREEGTSPNVLDQDTGEFKIWDRITGGGFFWSQDDNETDENKPGWHVDDDGHFSRRSWYGGIPAQGSYANNMEAILISQPVNLEGYTDVHLAFYTKYVLEGRQYDYVEVSITNDVEDEDSWTRLVKFPENDDSYDSSREDDSEYGWLHKDVMIPEEYISQEFYMKILLKTDNGITYRGVWIDDITIYGKTTANHAPVARFSATAENASYSRNVVINPPMDLIHIKGNWAYNNLPNGASGGINIGEEIVFDASMTFDPDANDDYISYLWDFGDDRTDTGEVVVHAYTGDVPLEGFFVVTLTATDEHDFFSVDTIFIHVGNDPPIADFIVTPYNNPNMPINDENDNVLNGVIDVFQGDKINFVQKSIDNETSVLEHDWVFECTKTGYKTTKGDEDIIEGYVGRDFLYEGLDDGVPIVPAPNTNPIDYEVTLTSKDEASMDSITYIVRVHPYARHTFEKSIRLGNTLSTAQVTLTWRGFLEEAAEAGLVGPDHPVFVYIDETAVSPEPLLAQRGGIGHVYDITAVGTFLQNGEEGFINAEISIPVLTSDLDEIGDSNSLQDDLKLEYYDEGQKRFFVVDDSAVRTTQGVKFIEGNVDHLSIYTAIVDSIYNTSNSKYYEVLPDLEIVKIEFSRQPAQNGQDVEVRVWIKNTGKIHANEVDVKIYDGDDLIGDRKIQVIKAGEDPIVIKEVFTVGMIDLTQQFENHRIKVYVNKQRAINEGTNNYGNNDKQEILVVTTLQTTTPSFASSSMIVGISAAIVVMTSMVYMRRPRKKRKD